METEIRQFLTASDLFRTACRASFISTFDRMLGHFLIAGDSVSAEAGYLDNIPLLRGCALQVQLEVLLQTWGDTESDSGDLPGLTQQCVCFAVLSELCDAVTTGNRRLVNRAMWREVGAASDDFLWLPSRLRALQVTLPFAAQAAVLAPESGLPSEELDSIRVAGGVTRDDLNDLLALTGRWRVNPDVLAFGTTLLTEHEYSVLTAFFEEFPDLLHSCDAAE